MAIWDAIKRAFTLPRAYNSMRDVARDPIGALRHAMLILENARFWANFTGQAELEKRLTRIIKALDALISDKSESDKE